MRLRELMLNSSRCSFVADVVADYGEYTYHFKLDCICDATGNLAFSVLEPDTITGLKGTVGIGGGNLVFEDQVLAFPPLTENELSPISAPMLMMQALRSGYIRAAGINGEVLHVIIDDSYEGEALQANIYFDKERKPVSCELIWNGSRILSLSVENFQIE